MIAGKELLELVPHRGKMFLLSRVTDFDIERRRIRAEYDGGPACLFYDPALGGIPGWVCFEFMAQSISALSGLAGRIEKRPPRIGVILNVSDMEIFTPVITSKVVVEAAQEAQLERVFMFEGAAYTEGTLCARAALTVMEIDSMEALIKK